MLSERKNRASQKLNMQNVPQIVLQRLKAGMPAVNHPDADVLTAFAERSLPELERAVVLEHMSRCGDCREIVALAFPAMEPIEIGVARSPSPASRWLSWPALRWGFVAAGVVAIASFGILQYQRRLQAPSVASKQTEHVEVAANESKKAIAPFVAAPGEKKDKLQSPAAPAFADSVDRTNAVDEKKGVAGAEASPARVLPSQAGDGTSRFHGATVAGPFPHGPRVPNQWGQQQNTAQNQAPMPAPPSAYSRQEKAAGDLSANRGAPAVAESIEAAAAAPAISTQNAEVAQVRNQTAGRTDGIERAKPPVARSSAGYDVIGNQPTQDQAVSRLKAQGVPGQIGGLVVDPSGAVVSNVRITITPSNKAATGATATAVTDSQGTWLIAGLPTGNYKAQAEAPGFRTTVLDFNYNANEPSMYSFTLSPGSVSETVEVAAGSARVQTETPAVGGPVTRGQMSQIPLNGRDVTQLNTLSAALIPRWTIGAAGGLQRSFDQGHTWQPVDVTANPDSFSLIGETSVEIVAKTSRAKAAKETANGKDADKAHKQVAAPLTFRAVAAAGADVWAGGSAGALYHSLDAGNHWTRIVPASAGAVLTGDVVSLEFPDPQHGKVSTSTSEVWITTDDGQTWRKQ
jgi:hypothetical protein